MSRGFVAACLLLVVFASAPAAASVSVPAAGQQAVRVKEDATLIYQAADSRSKVVATVPVGTTLDVIADLGEWYRVRQRSTGAEGFLRKTAVELMTGAGAAGQKSAAAAPGADSPAAQTGAQPGTTPGAQPGTTPGAKPAAKAAPSWSDRGYLAVSGAYQASNRSFTDRFTFAENAEQAHVTAAYRVKPSTGFDAGGGYRVWRNLAVGVQVSAFSQSDNAAIEATVPHPLYLRRDRSITGASASMMRDELAVHLQAAWVVPLGKKMLVTVAAGPSWLRVRQTVVEDIRWTESYPYDTVAFESAVKDDANLSRVGVNAGVDVAYYFTRTIGVGATVRYTGVNVSVLFRGGEQSLKAGGAQAAVGLRVRFAKPTRKPKPMPQPPPKMPVKK